MHVSPNYTIVCDVIGSDFQLIYSLIDFYGQSLAIQIIILLNLNYGFENRQYHEQIIIQIGSHSRLVFLVSNEMISSSSLFNFQKIKIIVVLNLLFFILLSR